MRGQLVVMVVCALGGSTLLAQSPWLGESPGPIYYNGGNVGIGTTSPSYNLDLFGGGAWFHQNSVQWTGGSTGYYPNLRLGQFFTGPYEVVQLKTADDGGWGHLSLFGLRWGQTFDFTRASSSAGEQKMMTLAGASLQNTTLTLYDGANDAQTPNVFFNTNGLSYLNGGYVGVGTTGPLLPLHVNSAVTRGSAGGVFISDTTGTGSTAGVGGQLLFGGNYAANTAQTAWSGIQGIKENGTAGNFAGALAFLARPNGGSQTEYMRITSAGNVGIGTTNPQYPLSVNGSIQTKEVIVNTGWSDYVFDPGYRLAPLTELAAYVKENHHLPEIPTAKEVGEKGVSLGEMQSKLLAKIEELTLHMIHAEERSDRIERENGELRREIEQLKSRSAQ
jgi:hypothetical protein